MGEETKDVSPLEASAPAVAAEEAPCPEVPKEEVVVATTAVVEVEGEKAPAEKIIEEAAAAGKEQEEKLAEAVEGAEEKAEEKTVVETREISPLPPAAEDAAVPFVEESYYVKDLKDSEKKALQELKAKIEEAIKTNAFLTPPKPLSREIDVEKEGEEEKKETGEGEGVAATEENPPAPESEEASTVVAEEAAPVGADAPVVAEAAAVVEKEEVVVEEAPAVGEEVVKEAPIPVSEEPYTKEVEEATTEEVVKEEETAAPPAGEAVEAASRDMPIEEDDSPSLEDLALWGVPLLHSKGDERTDVILLKFLRARDFKVNDAMSMLKETVVWRKEFEADNLIEEEIATEFDSVAYMHGVDKEGHPVCYNHYGVFQDKELYQKTFGDDAQFKKFLRWRIQVLEKGMQKLDFSPSGVHSMVQIIDLKDSPGFVKRRNITKKALTLLQDNYPELVAKQIFINVPWYFGALYSLHGKIATPRSKSKVVVARPDKVTETLFKYISPENVPARYGGLNRPNDTEFEGIEAPVKELTLKAGEKQTIELAVEESGSTVVWDVAVVGWEVVYGEEFVPSGEGGYTVIIQKAKKVTAAEEPMRNSFKATEPGKVVLTIENTSRRKRLVVYRHVIKKDTPIEC